MPSQKHYQANLGHYREQARKYAHEHPERVALTRYKHSHKVREFLQKVKERPCTDCGQRYPHYVMEFDHVDGHIDGDGKHNVSGLTSQRWSVVTTELAKCEVVCANCHRIRTWNRLYADGNWGNVDSIGGKNKQYCIRFCECFGTKQQRKCPICGGVGAIAS